MSSPTAQIHLTRWTSQPIVASTHAAPTPVSAAAMPRPTAMNGRNITTAERDVNPWESHARGRAITLLLPFPRKDGSPVLWQIVPQLGTRATIFPPILPMPPLFSSQLLNARCTTFRLTWYIDLQATNSSDNCSERTYFWNEEYLFIKTYQSFIKIYIYWSFSVKQQGEKEKCIKQFKNNKNDASCFLRNIFHRVYL